MRFVYTMKNETVAEVKNLDGFVRIAIDNEFQTYSVTARYNGKEYNCSGLTLETASKRYAKHSNEIAKIYVEKFR